MKRIVFDASALGWMPIPISDYSRKSSQGTAGAVRLVALFAASRSITYNGGSQPANDSATG